MHSEKSVFYKVHLIKDVDGEGFKIVDECAEIALRVFADFGDVYEVVLRCLRIGYIIVALYTLDQLVVNLGRPTVYTHRETFAHVVFPCWLSDFLSCQSR